MMKEFSIYKCKLVREKQVLYEGNVECPNDVFQAAKELGFVDYSEEILGMFTLDIKGNIIGYHEISHGDLNTSIVHPREVYKRALLANCGAIILIHNHPSGDITPSEEDVYVTKRLAQVGETMGIPVLDHLIIGSDTAYSSMKEQAVLNA